MGGSTTVHSANTHGPTEIAQGVVLAPQELQCIEDEDWLVVDPESRPPNSSTHGKSSYLPREGVLQRPLTAHSLFPPIESNLSS